MTLAPGWADPPASVKLWCGFWTTPPSTEAPFHSLGDLGAEAELTTRALNWERGYEHVDRHSARDGSDTVRVSRVAVFVEPTTAEPWRTLLRHAPQLVHHPSMRAAARIWDSGVAPAGFKWPGWADEEAKRVCGAKNGRPPAARATLTPSDGSLLCGLALHRPAT